jgi:proline iminopeptidase
MDRVEAIAIIENHYFYHNAFLKPNQIVENASRLKHIPITVVHGRHDAVCPVSSSVELKKVLPHIKLLIIPDAGHSTTEPGTKRALTRMLSKTKTRKLNKATSLSRSHK